MTTAGLKARACLSVMPVVMNRTSPIFRWQQSGPKDGSRRSAPILTADLILRGEPGEPQALMSAATAG